MVWWSKRSSASEAWRLAALMHVTRFSWQEKYSTREETCEDERIQRCDTLSFLSYSRVFLWQQTQLFRLFASFFFLFHFRGKAGILERLYSSPSTFQLLPLVNSNHFILPPLLGVLRINASPLHIQEKLWPTRLRARSAMAQKKIPPLLGGKAAMRYSQFFFFSLAPVIWRFSNMRALGFALVLLIGWPFAWLPLEPQRELVHSVSLHCSFLCVV